MPGRHFPRGMLVGILAYIFRRGKPVREWVVIGVGMIGCESQFIVDLKMGF